MPRNPVRITKVVFILVVAGIVAGAISVPLGYFMISYQYLKGNLTAEAEISAQIVEQVIGANPEMWEFEEVRLFEYLSRRPRSRIPEIRRIYNTDQDLVVESVEVLPSPILRSSFDLFDSGRTVGTIEISRSLRPLLVRTAEIGIVLFLTGFFSVLFIKSYPLRMLEDAEGRIHEALNIAEAERAKVDSIIGAIGDGISIQTSDFVVLFQNDIHKELLGDQVGKVCYEAYRHQGMICENCPLEDVFSDGGMHTVEKVMEKDGEMVFLEIKASPLRDQSGMIVAGIELVRDITQRKKLEEKLAQTQKMESVGQLAGGVAHDFNNILTAIIGYANLTLMKMPSDDPLKAYVEQIMSASEKAAALTGSLLAFSRKQIINPRNQDLNVIIRTMEKLLKRIIGEDIELDVQLSGEDLMVNVDQTQMQQVILNLATNARDAMPKGGRLTISSGRIIFDSDFVRTYGYGEAGMYAQLTVEDTGSGMDDETMQKVFEPFFTTKEKERGTGLGLSIVYGVVRQHKGFINLLSEKEAGSSFTIYLPIVTGGMEREEKVLEETEVKIVGGSETVLLAEDDGALRELTAKVLEEFGYRVIQSKDGEDAVTKFRERVDEIDLAILDVVMPRMNGKEAFEIFRSIRPDLKVLFMSGYTADILHVKDVLKDNLAFIHKPISPKALIHQVNSILSGKIVQ